METIETLAPIAGEREPAAECRTELTDEECAREAFERSQQAGNFFLDSLQQVPEAVVDVDLRRPLAAQTIRVYLPTRESPRWYEVLELEGQMVDRFPGSGIHIRLSELALRRK